MTHHHHTYWASIGRNVGANPLDLNQWHQFHRDIRDVIHEHCGTILSTVHGTSVWKGQEEDTTLVLFTIGERPLPSLRSYLSQIAQCYGQDAIGFVGGPGTDTYIEASAR